MKLIVAVDTEEDNWGSLRLTRYTCENIARIPAVQALFDQFNVTPTYQVLRVPEIAGGRLVPSAFTAWSP